MDVFEVIRSRRSVGRVKDQPVEREKIEKLLEAATWAPNHHNTEPWKFFVLTGEGRRPLGRVLAEIALEEAGELDEESRRQLLKKQEEKAFRAPVVIAVAVLPSSDPRALPIEETGAVNAAIQNMLLAAHALGLGAIWRTGKAAYHPKMKRLFGLKEKDELLGFVYVGYPEVLPQPKGRIPFQEKTVWVDADQSYA